MTKLEKHFPNSTIGVVHQNGEDLAPRHTGVTVTIHLRDGVPVCAEVSGGDHYAELGLEMNGKTLTGYDGAFDCPAEVLEILKEHGFKIDL